MRFDAASSHMVCTFSEALVGLLRGARQLQGLGFRLCRELATEVDVAARFHRCLFLCVTVCCVAHTGGLLRQSL
jgi:hypothetical protein